MAEELDEEDEQLNEVIREAVARAKRGEFARPASKSQSDRLGNGRRGATQH